jgi:hypothetical protein
VKSSESAGVQFASGTQRFERGDRTSELRVYRGDESKCALGRAAAERRPLPLGEHDTDDGCEDDHRKQCAERENGEVRSKFHRAPASIGIRRTEATMRCSKSGMLESNIHGA